MRWWWGDTSFVPYGVEVWYARGGWVGTLRVEDGSEHKMLVWEPWVLIGDAKAYASWRPQKHWKTFCLRMAVGDGTFVRPPQLLGI